MIFCNLCSLLSRLEQNSLLFSDIINTPQSTPSARCCPDAQGILYWCEILLTPQHTDTMPATATHSAIAVAKYLPSNSTPIQPPHDAAIAPVVSIETHVCCFHAAG